MTALGLELGQVDDYRHGFSYQVGGSQLFTTIYSIITYISSSKDNIEIKLDSKHNVLSRRLYLHIWQRKSIHLAPGYHICLRLSPSP